MPDILFILSVLFPILTSFSLNHCGKKEFNFSNSSQGIVFSMLGCGPGGSFPYLDDAVGPSGEVVGLEISPEVAINARRRIEKNRWRNVLVIEGDARTVKLQGKFDGVLMFAAADVYASPQSLANIFPSLKNDACVVAFGAKLSHCRSGKVLNPLLRLLQKLSFSSTPAVNYEPWGL